MDLILTSKLGTFYFNRNTILSKAKLIRDSITGQFFHPRPNEPKVVDEKTAQFYALHQLDRNLAEIQFDLDMKPEYERFVF